MKRQEQLARSRAIQDARRHQNPIPTPDSFPSIRQTHLPTATAPPSTPSFPAGANIVSQTTFAAAVTGENNTPTPPSANAGSLAEIINLFKTISGLFDLSKLKSTLTGVAEILRKPSGALEKLLEIISLVGTII